MTKWALTLNVSRPSLHRELRKLEAMGFVRYRPPDIEILDAAGLKSTLKHCPDRRSVRYDRKRR